MLFIQRNAHNVHKIKYSRTIIGQASYTELRDTFFFKLEWLDWNYSEIKTWRQLTKVTGHFFRNSISFNFRILRILPNTLGLTDIILIDISRILSPVSLSALSSVLTLHSNCFILKKVTGYENLLGVWLAIV